MAKRSCARTKVGNSGSPGVWVNRRAQCASFVFESTAVSILTASSVSNTRLISGYSPLSEASFIRWTSAAVETPWGASANSAKYRALSIEPLPRCGSAANLASNSGPLGGGNGRPVRSCPSNQDRAARTSTPPMCPRTSAECFQPDTILDSSLRSERHRAVAALAAPLAGERDDIIRNFDKAPQSLKQN